MNMKIDITTLKLHLITDCMALQIVKEITTVYNKVHKLLLYES